MNATCYLVLVLYTDNANPRIAYVTTMSEWPETKAPNRGLALLYEAKGKTYAEARTRVMAAVESLMFSWVKPLMLREHAPRSVKGGG